MRIIITSIYFICCIALGKSQVYSLGFENCKLSSSFGEAISNDTKSCVCGIPNEAFAFDGKSAGLTLPDTLTKLIKDDFTIDFYLNLNNTTEEQVDIFSIGNDCAIDSLLTIKYLLASNEIVVELLINNGQYFPIKAKLGDQCWNRITLVKNRLEYTLYLDNMQKGKAITTQNVPFAKNAKMAFSNSPCLKSIDDRLIGSIDEIKIYTNALTGNEILRGYSFPDRILNRDTSIFLGSKVDLLYTNSCATNITWSPSDELSDDEGEVVTASPTKTTTYFVQAEFNGCQSKDSVTIYMLDPTKQICEKILLPGAFSPNNDNLNDEFKVSNPFLIDELKSFDIINRWGEKIFTTSDKNSGWDGTYKNSKSEPGTYVYRISYTCKGKSYQSMNSFILLK
jgi:gliding motility-associated-like protein